MGKISDALDRASNEKIIKLEDRPSEEPKRLVPEDPETALAKDICRIDECNEQLVVLSAPGSADAENFKLLRGQILYPREGKRPRTIMVTSTFPSEGKTFVTANLAASIALSIDKSVLLLDCDLRRARLHEMFNSPNTEGLHEYLIGKKTLQELITRTQIEKLSLLTAGKAPSNPSELLSSTTMFAFIKEVRDRYQDRLIVIDSPPSQITAETRILAESVDGIIFVVMAQGPPRKDIRKALDHLGKDKILGIFFNGYNEARRGYNKYYAKYYKGK